MIATDNRLTDEQVIEALNYYVPLLRVGDWDIDIKMDARGYDIGDRYAEVTMTACKRRATIRFARYDDIPPECDPVDTELNLVHELIHISMGVVDHLVRDDASDKALDTAIENHVDALAGAFVQQRRAGGHRFSWEVESDGTSDVA